MSSLTNRAQDWLAQRTRSVPFSPDRVVPQKPPLFTNQMPWYVRGFVALMGSVMVLVAVVVLAFLGLLFWAIATA